MNDFTREELKELMYGLYYRAKHDGRMEDKNKILWNKLQSMVDNYCEHHLCNVDKKYNPLRCCKCQKIIL